MTGYRFVLMLMVGFVLCGWSVGSGANAAEGDGELGPVSRLADLQDELDRFAGEVLNRIQKQSFREKREYCGIIGVDKSGELIASSPTPGNSHGCQAEDDPDVVDFLASYHTPGGYLNGTDSETPSIDDLQADMKEGVDGYVATPGGRLWLNSHEDGVAILLCQKGCLEQDPNYDVCADIGLQSLYDASALQRRLDGEGYHCLD